MLSGDIIKLKSGYTDHIHKEYRFWHNTANWNALTENFRSLRMSFEMTVVMIIIVVPQGGDNYMSRIYIQWRWYFFSYDIKYWYIYYHTMSYIYKYILFDIQSITNILQRNFEILLKYQSISLHRTRIISIAELNVL